MKKVLVFLLPIVLSISSFSVPVSHKPIIKTENKKFWPWVDYLRVYKYQGGTLMLNVKLSEAWNEDLTLIVPVHTYKNFDLFPTNYQWVWIHYTITIPAGMKSLATPLNNNPYYKYNTYPENGSDYLSGPEFYVEYFGY